MKLGDTVIATPHDFKIIEQEIVREGRLASGKLVKDVVAVKKKFSCKYNVLTGAKLEEIMTEYDKHEFLPFEYDDRGTTKTTLVSFSEVPRSLLVKKAGEADKWLYVRVQFELIEQ